MLYSLPVNAVPSCTARIAKFPPVLSPFSKPVKTRRYFSFGMNLFDGMYAPSMFDQLVLPVFVCSVVCSTYKCGCCGGSIMKSNSTGFPVILRSNVSCVPFRFDKNILYFLSSSIIP